MLKRLLFLALILGLVTACWPVTPVTPAATEQPAIAKMPATSQPPSATLEIDGKTQIAGLGSYCWAAGNATSQSTCVDVAGIPTDHDPLLAAQTPYTATFHLSLETPPSALLVSVMPANAETIDGYKGLRLWDSSAGWSGALPLKQDVTLEFQESPGLYIIQLNASWNGLGNVSYGFLVQVGKVSVAPMTIQLTPIPESYPIALQTIAPLTRIGKGNLLNIAVSKDGKWLAVGTSLGVYLYETTSQTERWFRAFDSAPTSLSFSPDGARLAIGQKGNRMPIVQTSDGETLLTLTGEEGLHGDWSPDGKSILTSGGCEQVLVWDAETGAVTHTVQPVKCNNATPGFVNAAWSGDGKRIYVGTVTGYVLAWDAATFQSLAGYEPHPPQYTWSTSVAVSPVQPLFALENGLSVALLDGKTGQIVKLLQSERQDVPVSNFTWSPDGRKIAGGNGDRLLIWDVETGKEVASILDHRADAGIGWMPDNETIVGLISRDGNLIGLNTVTGKITLSMGGFDLPSVYAAPGWDGDTLLTFNGTMESRWNPLTGEIIAQNTNKQPSWLSTDYAARSPDGRFIASPNGISDSSTGQEILRLRDASQHDKVAWSSDGKYLVSATSLYADQTVVWNAQNGEVVARLSIDSGSLNPYIGALSWSPDSLSDTSVKRIAGAGSLMNPDNGLDAGFIVIWDAQTGKMSQLLTAGMNSERIQSVAWSPDNRWLAAGGTSGKIYLWDMQSYTPAFILSGHSDQVLGLNWSPGGKFLASTALDGTVLVWKAP